MTRALHDLGTGLWMRYCTAQGPPPPQLTSRALLACTAQVCEEHGCFEMADPSKVSDRAKKRGLLQLGSRGSGNHYTEIQVGKLTARTSSASGSWLTYQPLRLPLGWAASASACPSTR